jgi:hypothetical protein
MEQIMWYQNIVAVYDKAENASEAARALKASGFPADDISLLNRDSFGDVKVREPRLWCRLFGGTVNESVIYGRTIEAGGAVLTLRLPYGDAARAMKVLDIHTPSGGSHGSISLSAGALPATQGSTSRVPPTTEPVVEEMTLRLTEEKSSCNKREETAKTRVRRFVIEKPVDSRVGLHQEHAEIVRQAIADRVGIQEVDATDTSAEITKSSEEAGVRKFPCPT